MAKKKQSKKTAASSLPQKVEEVTPEGRARPSSLAQTREKRTKPPKVKPFNPCTHATSVIMDIQAYGELWRASMLDATGTADLDISAVLMLDLYDACATHGVNDDGCIRFNAALAAMHGMQPKNELEGMLCAQMVSVHVMAMRVLSIANLKGQTPYSIEQSVTHSTKLMRTFLMQVEALQKLRGKTTQQKVIVEHVNVQAGGQAVVGAVTHTGGEGAKGE